MSLDALIDRLAAFEPNGFPVISLYLNTQPDEHGRERATPFARRELKERVRSYPPHTKERESLERDREKIDAYVLEQLRPSANGLALFACDGAGLFEAVQLDAPIEESLAIVADQPHLYPLARLNDQYPRYAALLVNSNAARLFVFGPGRVWQRGRWRTRRRTAPRWAGGPRPATSATWTTSTGTTRRRWSRCSTASCAGRGSTASSSPAPEQAAVAVAEELVTRARRTSAGVRFIEDPELLAQFGGVGAFLRYRVASPGD